MLRAPAYGLPQKCPRVPLSTDIPGRKLWWLGLQLGAWTHESSAGDREPLTRDRPSGPCTRPECELCVSECPVTSAVPLRPCTRNPGQVGSVVSVRE